MAATAEVRIEVRTRRTWPFRAACLIGRGWPRLGAWLVRAALHVAVAEYRVDPIARRWRSLGRLSRFVVVERSDV